MMIRRNDFRLRATVRRSIPTVLVLALLSGPAVCFGSDLPSSKEIIAKMIEAEGGVAAKKKIKNREVKLKVDMGMGGMFGIGVMHSARPANMRMRMEIDGMGTIQEGVTDGVAWSYAMMTGPQVKEGAEKSMALWDADFDGLLGWEKHFKSIECVARETLEGKEFLKVEFTRHDGDVITTYVDGKTYLPYRSDMKLATPMGKIDLTAYSEDYREIDGVQYSHTTRLEVMGQKRLVTIESIKHNVELPKDCFKLPEDVQDILTADADAPETDAKPAALGTKTEKP